MQMISYVQWRPEAPESVEAGRARRRKMLLAAGFVGAAIGIGGWYVGLFPFVLLGGLILSGALVEEFESEDRYDLAFGRRHRVALVKELLADCGVDVDERYGVPLASWNADASRRTRRARDYDMGQLAQMIDKAYRTQGAVRYGTVVFQWQDSSLLASSTAMI